MRSIFVLYMSILCFQVIGQSQSDLNLSAERSYLEKDNELNQIYQEILTEYADDVEFIANLRNSERLWIKFRDAEMLMKYPENSGVRGGTVFTLCYFNYKTELTQKRIDTLKQWLEGEPEGEVCSGSVKIR
jgi:uncharacterized protein YecT (DUF1311 family)